MMLRSIKIIILVLVFILNTKIDLCGQSLLVNDIRARFALAVKSEEACEELFNEMNQMKGKREPVFTGYLGAVTISMSKYTGNPFGKYEYFQDGKKLVESAIREAPANVELRFIRLSIQENAPSFLGYTSNVAADKKIILEQLQNLPQPKLKEAIINYIGHSKVFSDAEKQKVSTYR